jgi:hypothetical protein
VLETHLASGGVANSIEGFPQKFSQGMIPYEAKQRKHGFSDSRLDVQGSFCLLAAARICLPGEISAESLSGIAY